MTAKNRTTIKSVFEQGDKPQGSDYADLVDSYVSIADSTAQALSSPLTVTGSFGASTTVSAPTVEASAASFTTVTVSGAVSANSVAASAAAFTQASVATLTANALTVTTVVSADTVIASAATFSIGSAANWTVGVLTVTTIATAQATASAIGGTGQTVPTTAAGFITVQVCGATVAIPYFPVA